MQPISRAIPGVIAAIVRAAPLSPAKVAFAWRTAVGVAISRSTDVHLEARTLIVDATGPQWTEEVRRSAGVILPRLQQLLGPGVIAEIRVRLR